MNKLLKSILLTALLVTRAAAAPTLHPAVGVSYFVLQHTDVAPTPLAVDESSKFAPFAALECRFNAPFSLRASYHFINHASTTAQYPVTFALPVGAPPTFIWSRYEDDIHLLSLAPEFTWPCTSRLALTAGPQLNWIASRGTVSHSSNGAFVLLLAPQRRNDEGFTLGGGVRLRWEAGNRLAVSAGYHYVNLRPSFGRQAHQLSAGASWAF